MRKPSAVPARIGPVEFSAFGAKWVAVRSSHDFDQLMCLAGGWEAGSRRWLNPLIRELRLFRQAGLDLGEALPHN